MGFEPGQVISDLPSCLPELTVLLNETVHVKYITHYYEYEMALVIGLCL